MQYRPVQVVQELVAQAEPTSSAAQVAQHVATAAVQEWHPLVPEDQSDKVYRIANLVNDQPVY